MSEPEDPGEPPVRPRRLAACGASRTPGPGAGGVLAVLAVMLFGFRAAPAAAHSLVRRVSVRASSGAAALSVDLSRPAPYRLFRLAHPERVVIDFSDTGFARDERLPRARGVIDAIRQGVRAHGGLRLVVQLRTALSVRARWMPSRRGAASRLLVVLGRAPATAAVARSARRPIPFRAGRDIVVAVDAGHGGEDPGAIGPGGLEEKTVTLKIARDLARRIDAEPGMRAVLTRDRDVFLPLRERMHIARSAKADLFVSIHADSIRDAAISGSSVYVLSLHGATDEAARWLAERENSADRLGGVSLAREGSRLASVLLDLSQSASLSASMNAAGDVLASLARTVPVCKRRVQQAAFVVLKSPDIPSMLVETAYISNRADERRLRSVRGEHAIAGAIFLGLRRYFERHPPTGTLFARERGSGRGPVLAGAAGGPATTLAR